MPNPVVHWEIIGPDGLLLQKFYGDLFDWQVNADNPYSYGIVHPGSGPGGGIAGDPDGARRVSVYIEVDDLQAYLDKATQLGATTVLPPTDMGDFWIALFSDPAGNITGLTKGTAAT